MTQQLIPASPAEIQALAQRITEAQRAQQVAEMAARVAEDLFLMFCGGRGLDPAVVKCVGVGDDGVIVEVPEPKPELVKEA